MATETDHVSPKPVQGFKRVQAEFYKSLKARTMDFLIERELAFLHRISRPWETDST